ncbi:hypothetical protein LCGC14_1922250 [marine sediment metagenome]|uniref:AAA+ ATPase domain-containing protein n=1 Tax=marine sediment metagenome TaxID=412755 RepID=A0A0F9FR59_9ZZZZ
MTRETKPAVHWTERVRVILALLAYIVWVESTFPTPFIQSRFGQLTYYLILFFVTKEVWRWRQEQSARFYARTTKIYTAFQDRRFSLTDYTRYRIQRLLRFFFIAYSLGWLIDGASDSCSGALACAMATPSMLVNNWQEIIFFAIRLAMSMMSIFGMMWIMARMDLHRTILPDSIKTRFTDVYGQDNAVDRLSEIRGILDYPDEIEARGGYMPGGVLLEGPPGTGKTLLAEAFAGETGKPFVSVGPESFTNMFVGVPVLKVKMLFRHLRNLAVKHGGVVCFMDEIDALGSRGGGIISQTVNKVLVRDDNVQMPGQGSGALQMLLTEMSGIAKPKGLYNKLRVMLGFKPVPPPPYRILWIGATNMSGALDPALLRPGRFDRRIKVGYPDQEGRRVTFQEYLGKVDHDVTEDQIKVLARENPQATGASIKDAVNEGLLKAVREGRDVITWDDMRAAILWKEMGEETGTSDLAEDRRRVSLHEAAHAVASHYFRPEAPIQYASVVSRDKGTGGFVQAVDEVERFVYQSRIIADVKTALASVWSERLFFEGNLSVGPGSDLRRATNLVTVMVTKHAMGNSVMVWDTGDGNASQPAIIPSRVLREIERMLKEIYDDMAEFMYPHRDQVELVAQLLDENGTVDGAEIHELIRRSE